jgi:hypothetical protein
MPPCSSPSCPTHDQAVLCPTEKKRRALTYPRNRNFHARQLECQPIIGSMLVPPHHCPGPHPNRTLHHPPVIPQLKDNNPGRYVAQEAGTAAPPFLFFAFAFRLVRSRGFSAAMPALHTSAYRA